MVSPRPALALFAVAVSFVLSSPAPAQTPAALSPAYTDAGTVNEAPFLLPKEPAPLWLTLDCSQFDQGFCHYIPHPDFPNDCCIPSPKRPGCVSYCTI